MIVFWCLAFLLPLIMFSGLAMMTGLARVPGLSSVRRVELGWRVTECAAILSLIAFLAGLNIALV